MTPMRCNVEVNVIISKSDHKMIWEELVIKQHFFYKEFPLMFKEDQRPPFGSLR